MAADDLTSVLRLTLLVREAPSWTYDDFRKLLDTRPGTVSATVAVPDATLLRQAWVATLPPEPATTTDNLILGVSVVQCLQVGGSRQPDSEVEAELESILVHPDARRQAIGSRLLDTVIDWCRRQHAGMLRLEVRSSNQPALALYHRHGFQATGNRPRYYRHPEEDAVLMELVLASTRLP